MNLWLKIRMYFTVMKIGHSFLDCCLLSSTSAWAHPRRSSSTQSSDRVECVATRTLRRRFDQKSSTSVRIYFWVAPGKAVRHVMAHISSAQTVPRSSWSHLGSHHHRLSHCATALTWARPTLATWSIYASRSHVFIFASESSACLGSHTLHHPNHWSSLYQQVLLLLQLHKLKAPY